MSELAIHESINPFGGFAPFPNSIMIPFMGAQSAVLGYQFGLSYEAGKRTIKAMDNVDFNKFIIKGDTIEFEGHQENLITVMAKKHWREQITLFRESLPDAQSLMHDIIEQSVQIELKKANRTPSAMKEIFDAGVEGFLKLKGDQAFDFMAWWEQVFGASPSSGTQERPTTADTQLTKEPEPPLTGSETKEPEPKEPEPVQLDLNKIGKPYSISRLTFEFKIGTGTITRSGDEKYHILKIKTLQDALNQEGVNATQNQIEFISAYRIWFQGIYRYWI